MQGDVHADGYPALSSDLFHSELRGGDEYSHPLVDVKEPQFLQIITTLS